MTVGYGKTAGSPLEAQPLAMFRSGIDDFVMNRDRLLDAAVNAVLELARGYVPGQHQSLKMPGREVWQAMQEWLHKTQRKGHLTPHDVTTGTRVAMIVTGGDVDAGTLMTEDEILALERKPFWNWLQRPRPKPACATCWNTGSRCITEAGFSSILKPTLLGYWLHWE